MKYFKNNYFKSIKLLLFCCLILLFVFAENCKKPNGNEADDEKEITTVNIDNITDTLYVPLKIIIDSRAYGFESVNKDLFFHYIGNISYSDSLLYVLDSKGSKIVKLSKNGDFIKKIGRLGSGPGEFLEPRYMTVRYNKIFVSDQANGRIQILDLEGKYLSQINNIYSGNFNNEFDITKENEIVTKSMVGEKFIVTMYDSTGEVKNRFGKIENVPNSSYINIGLNDFYPLYDENNNIIWLIYYHLPIIKKYDINGNLLGEIKYEGKFVDEQNKKMAESEKTNKAQGFMVSTVPLIRTASFLPNNKLIIIFNKSKLNVEIDLSKNDSRPRIIKWIDLPSDFENKTWLCHKYNNELVCSVFSNIGITENLSKFLMKNREDNK